jgi:hypothetical protein
MLTHRETDSPLPLTSEKDLEELRRVERWPVLIPGTGQDWEILDPDLFGGIPGENAARIPARWREES